MKSLAVASSNNTHTELLALNGWDAAMWRLHQINAEEVMWSARQHLRTRTRLESDPARTRVVRTSVSTRGLRSRRVLRLPVALEFCLRLAA